MIVDAGASVVEGHETLPPVGSDTEMSCTGAPPTLDTVMVQSIRSPAAMFPSPSTSIARAFFDSASRPGLTVVTVTVEGTEVVGGPLGGVPVPVAVFFSEDGHEVARYGERTLARYRQLVEQLTGEGCATGFVKGADPVQQQVVQEWVDQFERVQWILRLSPRLRRLHGD